ncbi:MAG: HD family phosphohydrolase [Halanaerobiales bacterium]
MFIITKLAKWWKNIKRKGIPLSSKQKKIFWGFIFIIALTFILTLDLIPNQLDLRVGQPSPTDIEAPRTMTFVDEEKTSEMREIARESVSRRYEENLNAYQISQEEVSDFFLFIEDSQGIISRQKEIRENQELDLEQLTEEEREQLDISYEELVEEISAEFSGLSRESIESFLNASQEDIDLLRNTAINILEDSYEKRIYPEDIPELQETMTNRAQNLDYSREFRLALADLLDSVARPTMIVDQETTELIREEAARDVPVQQETVLQGEMILRRGEIVTEDDLRVLEALGLQRPGVKFINILGVIIIIMTLIILASLYLNKYKNDIWNTAKKIVFLELMVLLVVILAKIIDLIPSLDYFYLPYLVPIAMASILITVLLDSDVGIFSTIIISFLVALIFNNNYNVALLGFVGGMVGIYSVSKLSQRNDLVKAGFNVSAVLFVLSLGLRLTQPLNSLLNVLGHVSMAVVNGILVAILANGLLPYIENVFGFTSSVKLLELSNPSQPLLNKMVFEAAGTYNHCLVVANLAETAANNIGADSLLTRVGAYYHDIGKLKRSYFFIENHMGRENPHDKLSPNLSALIIKSHVKDGVEMAKEYKLPTQIIDIIREHHGTNLISYFYQEALKDNIHDSIEEGDFRYEGPKPQTKESAIIMLADICEAAVRSKNFNKSNHNRMEGLVRELIKNKLIEGQLDESDLSLGDLDIIAESFVKVLTGIYHQRIDYPENILKEMKKDDKNDQNTDK